ncbi:MAG: HNH endonuclease [Corynebacterium humireducens]|jgi:hypothetical protein|uniref:HNH endonuclease n=1 Tax=Corynebacterium humireducens TaxID=1223514 RepID=A0A7X6PMS2_9CORY|nr:HNH endonuclease [Corynebacterium humireducens]
MDIVAAMEALRGVTVLEAIASGHLTRQRIVSLGFRDAGAWILLAEVFLGPTRHRKLQAQALDAAREGGLSLDALRVVDKHTRKLLPGAAVTEWELRAELCHLRGTVDEIDRAASARVRDLNRTVPDAEDKAFAGRALKGGKNTDARGLRTATITLPERHMTAFLGRLLPIARRLRRDNPRLTYEQAMADALLAGGTGATGPTPPVPLVVVPVPEWAQVLRREKDDTIFGLTDGTTMTGRELVEQVTAEHHYVGVYHPVEGPVDLYRSERTASPKQQKLLAAETLLCPTPVCTTSADDSQVHHLKAWKQGGNTNVAEMTIACQVHNARNDDDPDAPPRNGRLEREPGGVVFHPPDGGPPQRNRHPLRELSAMGLIAAGRA